MTTVPQVPAPPQVPAALCGIFPGARLQALQRIRYFFSEGRTVPIGKVVTVVEVPEGGTFQVFWKYGPQTHLTVPKEDIGRLALLLDSPLAVCHAARWLATHHPERIALVEEVERVFGEMETPRSLSGAGQPHWFILNKISDTGVEETAVPVREAVEWAQTARGGRQMVFWRPPSEGCAEWGLCEAGVGSDRR